MFFKRFLVFVLIASSVAVVPRATMAENIWDPQPPMTWEEMKRCELVVAAHYQSHEIGDAPRVNASQTAGLTHDKQQTLVLHVDRVLQGRDVKAGALLRVELRHWYSIELSSFDDFRDAAKQDGIARLCYKWQPNNPGGLVPRQIVPDVRQDVLYFFPKASTPFLERSGQVQTLVFEKDWNAVLHGFTPSVGFRATQNFSEKLREAALDEIDTTRNPATLNLLFDWLAAPTNRNFLSYSSQQVLMAIGDRNGDVYNRARQRFLASADNWVDYDKLTPDQQAQGRRDQRNNEGMAGQQQLGQKCAQIMAKADGERAARDFVRLIEQKRPLLSALAQDQLGSTDSDTALDFAFHLLERPETVRQGAEIIRKLLVPGYRQELKYRGSTPQTAHLTTLTKVRLKKVLQLPLYNASSTATTSAITPPANQRSPLATLREILGGFLPREVPAPVSLSHAEQVLLHPDVDPKKLISSPFESNWTPIEKEGVAFLVAIDNERDPRFVPLLVTLMHDVSPWLKSQEGYRATSHYWQMFPHAFKRELDKQGLTAPLLQKSLEYEFPGAPGRLLNRPNAVWSLSRNGSLGLFRDSPDDDDSLLAKRYASSPGLRRALANYCTMTLSLDYMGPDTDALHLLWSADPAAARPLIERVRVQQELKLAAERAERLSTPARPAPQWPFATSQSRFRFLALAVTAGHTEFVEELLSNFPVPSRQSQNTQTKYPQWYDVQVLLWSDNPRVLQRYLQITDAALANSASDLPPSFSYSRSLIYPEPSQMVQALFVRHPREFFDRTLRLLRSTSPVQRSVSNSLLENVLYWNLGYDPEALTRARTAKLKTIAPLLQRLSSLPEEPMRIALLQHLGVVLPANSVKRLATLRQLLSNPDPVIARNALRLLELQTGDYGVDYLWDFPPAQQDRLWNALVADHVLALQDTPTPLGTGGEPF